MSDSSKKSLNVNNSHKDSLFCWIFGREENKCHLLSLYNALNGTDYDDPSLIEINTLEDVIYMKMKNDVSCIIGNNMYLFEHQSTFNPNMPYRELQYCAKLYNGIVAEKNYDVYGSQLVKFPAPHCYVFYNGSSFHNDVEILRLSDAFESPSAGYEWTTTMLNVNFGHNKALMEKCQALYEYADFVNQVRVNRIIMTSESAVDKAVEYIIAKNGVLSNFFKVHRAEVNDMCSTLTYYDEEHHIQSEMKIARENGRAIGLAEGRAEGRAEGQTEGKAMAELDAAIRMLKDGMDENIVYKYFPEQFELAKKKLDGINV